MSRATDANKALVLRFINEVQIGKDLGLVDELFSPSLVNHSAAGVQKEWREGMKAALRVFFHAFPDLDVEVDLQVAEGDMVSTRKIFRGTHRGEFRGVPPSGNKVEFVVVEFMRVRAGKIIEHWGMVDRPTLMDQIQAEKH